MIDGLSGDQRLYLGWVQVWRGKVREAEAIQRIKTDPHSPAGGARHGAVAKPAGLLRGVRLEARRQNVFAAGSAREYLVSVNLSAVEAWVPSGMAIGVSYLNNYEKNSRRNLLA